MSNIIIPKPWQSRHIKPVDEKHYYNRREIIKKMGLAGATLVSMPFWASACNRKKSGNAAYADDGAPSFSFPGMEQFYPASENEKYKVERKITEEYAATHYNNFYEFIHPDDNNIYNVYKYIGRFDTSDWKFEVSGLAENTGTFYLADIIKKFGLEERVYRFRCVEAWAMTVPWTGFPLSKLIKFLQPKNSAKYIRMISFADEDQMPGVKHQTWYPWPYFEGLRMDEAMNELTFMATGLYGKALPKQNGAPMRLVVPWKYGYKSPKSIIKLEFIDHEPETFWHKLAPSEYSFFSNVNPDVPHPRWSQAMEELIPNGEKVPTQMYNGYGEYVAKMYG